MEKFLQKISSKFENDRYAKLSEISLTEASPGYARAIMVINEKHLNAADVVQGGAIFTLADFAFAVASNSHGRLSLAIDAEISFFRSVRAGTLTATAREISLHNKLGTYLIDITNEKNELIAHFKGTVYRKNTDFGID
jgi:acyl-CoA thioesterase